MDIFSSLPFPSGTANIPENVVKNNDFYRADFFSPFTTWIAPVSSHPDPENGTAPVRMM
jgi:hypothetical protein